MVARPAGKANDAAWGAEGGAAAPRDVGAADAASSSGPATPSKARLVGSDGNAAAAAAAASPSAGSKAVVATTNPFRAAAAAAPTPK